MRSVAPSLAHAGPAPALGVEAEPVLQVGGHLEARGEHDDVDRVLDSAGDDSVLGDLVDSVPVGVDQVDVRAVERREIPAVDRRAACSERKVGGRELGAQRWIVDLFRDLAADERGPKAKLSLWVLGSRCGL